MGKLPVKLKIYLIATYIITIVSFIFFIRNNHGFVYNKSYIYDIITFSILLAIAETSSVGFKNMSFSTSFAIQLASFILFGPLSTIIIMILGFTFRVLKVGNGYKHLFNTPFYGTLNNYCVLILSVIYGNIMFIKFHGIHPIDPSKIPLFPIVVFCLIFFLVNTLIISILLSIMTNKNILYCYISNIRLSILNILALAPFGLLLASMYPKVGESKIGFIVIMFAILLLRYTFSLYIDSKNQYIQTVDALARAVEARDKYTEGHSQRVSELSTGIAKVLKYDEWKINQLKIAAILHDVGKIGISDQILNKPGKLTEEEFTIIKSHPNKGFDILNNIKNLEGVVSIVRHHHERYDGKGYPDGKKAEELGLEVFIVQLADSIDAMATDRPYRKALTQEKIMDEIRNNSGTQFHPKVVEAYFKMIHKERK